MIEESREYIICHVQLFIDCKASHSQEILYLVVSVCPSIHYKEYHNQSKDFVGVCNQGICAENLADTVYQL